LVESHLRITHSNLSKVFSYYMLMNQHGTLTEGEGSVQLTSSFLACFVKKRKIIFISSTKQANLMRRSAVLSLLPHIVVPGNFVLRDPY